MRTTEVSDVSTAGDTINVYAEPAYFYKTVTKRACGYKRSAFSADQALMRMIPHPLFALFGIIQNT